MNVKNFIKEIASGPRVSGTEGEEKALSFLEDCIQRIGFSTKRESFSFQASVPKESYLQVGDVQYEVLPLGFSKPGEVKQHISFIESLESDMLVGLEDCIAIYPDFFFKRSEYESLLSSNIGAIVLAPGDRLADAPTYTFFWEKWLESGRIIAATIGKRNLYRISPGDEATLVSRLEEKLLLSANLVWDMGISGNEDIYIFAHHDSVPRSWGVTDNACGVAVLLRVCELLSKEHLKTNVIFATFGAHELKGAAGGSRVFLRKRLKELEERGVLAINIDIQGYKLGLNRAFCNAQWLADSMNQLKHKLKYPISVDVRSAELLDSFFFEKYVPTMSFQRRGYYSHSSLGNTLEIVDYVSIERTSGAIKELVLEIDKKKIRTEISKRIVEERSKYLEFDIYDL